MVLKQFKSIVNKDRTIKLPDDLDIDEGTELNVILIEDGEDISSYEIARYLEDSKSFDFLKAEEEDIYSEDDLKVKY
jgi:hypothetical protein